MRSCIAAAATLVLSACASATPPAPAAPTLAYALPAVNPARYLIGDTTRIIVDAPGERTVETTIAVQAQALVGVHMDSTAAVADSAALQAAVSTAAAGLLASVRIDSIAGEFSVGGRPTIVLDSADAPEGAVLLTLAPAGADSLRFAPALSPELTRIIGGPSWVRHVFVPLPGGAVAPGTVWTDTITTTEEDAGVRSTNTTVIASVLQGDTMIDGRTVQVIASNLATTIEVNGTVDQLQVTQHLTGTGTARTFWDAGRSLLLRQEEQATATGSMDLPALGASGVPVRASMHRVIVLLP